MFKWKKAAFAAAIAVIALVSAVSCSSPPTAKPLTPASVAPVAPRILDIVGVRELKPSQESSLVCAASEDTAGTFRYTWTAEKGSIKGDGKQVTWVTPAEQGDFAITVKVSNAAGEATFSKKFKVTNNPFNNDTPDATIYLRFSMPSGNTVTASHRQRIWTTSEIECVVGGQDPSTLSFRWIALTGKLAGNGLNEGKASRVGWIAPGVAGQYKVTVEVTDKSGNIARGEVDYEILCCKD